VSEPAASPAAQPAAPVTQAAAAPSPVPPTPQPAASAVTQAVPAPAPEAPEPAPDARPQIEELIAAYARAIEARNIGEIRRLYPSLTSDQQRDWEQFFHAARNVRAQLTVTRLDVNGAAADVTVGGSLEYDTGNGTQHQPMSFHASAALENGVWRLRSVR